MVYARAFYNRGGVFTGEGWFDNYEKIRPGVNRIFWGPTRV